MRLSGRALAEHTQGPMFIINNQEMVRNNELHTENSNKEKASSTRSHGMETGLGPNTTKISNVGASGMARG